MNYFLIEYRSNVFHRSESIKKEDDADGVNPNRAYNPDHPDFSSQEGASRLIQNMRTKVEEKYRFHDVLLKENLHEAALSAGSSADVQAAVEISRTAPGDISSILHAIYSVNPASVTAVLDPETGEPMVVYYGTSEAENRTRGMN